MVLKVKYTKEKYSPSPEFKRRYTAANRQRFKEYLGNESWQITIEEENANKAMDKFLYTFNRNHELAFPISYVSKKSIPPPVSNELRQMRETLALLRRTYDGHTDQNAHLIINNYQKLYIKTAEQEHKLKNLTSSFQATNHTENYMANNQQRNRKS